MKALEVGEHPGMRNETLGKRDYFDREVLHTRIVLVVCKQTSNCTHGAIFSSIGAVDEHGPSWGDRPLALILEVRLNVIEDLFTSCESLDVCVLFGGHGESPSLWEYFITVRVTLHSKRF